MSKKIVVAIVDSGIDTSIFDNIDNNFAGGICFEYIQSGDIVLEKQSITDDNGHGTMCASTIKRISPLVSLFIIKILDKNKETNSKALLKALEYLKSIECDVINLSLAAKGSKISSEIERHCDELRHQGKILICSLCNNMETSYPASLKSVIGVNGSLLCNDFEYWYNKYYQIQAVSDITPVMTKTIGMQYELFGGNSKATAVFTGIVANCLSKGIINYHDYLELNSMKKYWDINDINKDIYTPVNKSEICSSLVIQKKVIQILCEILKIDSKNIEILKSESLFSRNIGLNPRNAFEIIKSIEEQLKINFEYELITLRDFNSLYKLCNLVEQKVGY